VTMTALPAALHAWGMHHLGAARLQAVLDNATVMSACVVFVHGRCLRNAHFHVSGLDHHQKIRVVLRGLNKPMGGDMTAYKLQLPGNGGLIFDYGGNIGIAAVTSYLRNTRHERSGCVRVVSVEPVPESYLFLRWNLIENGIPIIHNAGAAKCGVRALNVAATHDGRNVTLAVGYRSMEAVIDGGGLAPEPNSPLRRYSVQSITLGELLDEFKTPASDELDILKLDCEGCEAEVLHELTSSPSLARRIQSVTGELHGCSRHLGRSVQLSCGSMAKYFRGQWNRTQNSLQLV